MASRRSLPWWGAVLLAILGLGALYAGPLRTGFLNDDYLFLEQARTRPLSEALTRLDPLGNYYRPLSRQLYFALLTPVAGGRPAVFHAVNAALFVAALGLLADLLRALVPPGGVMAGLLYFALLPMQRVNLTWISCSQDLLALVGVLGAVALLRRGRRGAATLAYLAAVASKEAALPLPAALLAWEVWIERRDVGRALARIGPLAAVGLVWAGVAFAMRAAHAAAVPLVFSPGDLAAAYLHLAQSLVGLDAGARMLDGLRAVGPSVLPLLFLAPLALWYARGRAGGDGLHARSGEAAADPPRDAPAEPSAASPRDTAAAATPGEAADAPSAPAVPARAIALFAVIWIAAFGLVTWPVAWSWSGYYYTLAAVGGALLVGLALRRGGALAWVLLATGLLWWNGGAAASRAFAVAPKPWVWTSHLTSGYFDRAAALTDTLSRQLVALEPDPPDSARFFFATLPPWAGFQMGNGALVRNLYRDPSLESYFYSQFSESTAAGYPCGFFYWNGARLTRLYPDAADPMFQVGSDLMLLDRPAGAVHAFRRALESGGSAMDNWYWMGWAEMMGGHRAAAEAAWGAFGARDDSLKWIAHLRAAHNALTDGDTLTARRHLAMALEFGIGRPEAHAVLGELMLDEQPKWAMLELKVAVWLNPKDWMARRDLVYGLAASQLDDQARDELEVLKRTHPDWEKDPQTGATARTLARRAGQETDIVVYR